jgi:signal transduction histidine kinase
MLNRRGARTLSTILAVRMVAVSAAAFACLFGFFFARYMLDTPFLRRATLEAEIDEVAQALFSGGDPATLHQYQLQPPAYAFRAFNLRRAEGRKLVAQVNPQMLPDPAAHMEAPGVAASGDLEQTFDHVPSAGGGPELWLLTERRSEGSHSLWIQAGMLGDPDWEWAEVITAEMLDHVVIPALIVVPALTLAMIAATRHALRPLQRIADQAAELGNAVTAGRKLAKLPEAGLPLEFSRVVAALNAMLGKLEQSLEQQRQFTADAAHELRTPLAVLMLEIEQLPRDPVTARLAEEIGGLSRLVNQLLRFAQAEGAMARERNPVDVAAVARGVCEDLAPVALRREQEIAFDAPGAPVFASGQEDLVEAALRNIVDNALRHAPPRSSVVVTVEKGPRILVEDSGPGVPDDQKEKIFQRFWRADRSQPTGAGIGLALVRRIAQLHGGDVRVEDRPGGGARFVLTMEPWSAG